MSTDTSYRRLAGLLLLTALLPMPFLDVVLAPFWMAAAAAGAWLVARPSRPLQLSVLAQNGLAVVILAVVVAAGGVRLGPLRPLGHLLLLLAALRGLQVADRRSYLRALPLLGLVWVVSLAASTHITVLVYFAASAAVWWWAGMQTQLMSLTAAGGLVRPRHAAVAAAAALLLAVPVFVAMPRLRSPWVAGRGSLHSVTGFSSRVELSGIGSISSSQQLALVLRSVDGRAIDPGWTRLRATAFERVTGASWAPRSPEPGQTPLTGTVRLGEGTAGGQRLIELEVLLDRPGEYLFLPEGTVEVQAPRPVLIDPAGGLVLQPEGGGPLEYTVRVAAGAGPPRVDPPPQGGPRFEPHPEVLALAARVTRGLESTDERARAVEAYLRSSFSYSMSGMRRIGPDPIAWFLLESRTGHCEYFAGGMVVLLEALGVPARMVGGYSGGSVSPEGDELTVREANAHTWVEVWLGPEGGWQAFDPTPASGVPGISVGRLRDRARFAWQWLQSSWDRYVLTFGIAEQMDLLAALGESVVAPLLIHWRGAAVFLATLAAAAAAVAARRWGSRSRRGARATARTPAARAMARLGRRLERVGAPLPVAATVRSIGRTAAGRWPEGAGPIAQLVELAEGELYDAERRSTGAAEARRLWAELRRAMRRPAGR